MWLRPVVTIFWHSVTCVRFAQSVKLRDEAEKRCEMYAGELKALESSIDARVSDYQNEARIKTFELDRLQVRHLAKR